LIEVLASDEEASQSSDTASLVRWRSPFLWTGVVLVIILAVIALWWVEDRHHVTPLSEAPAILLVGDFENRTDEAIFDSTVRHLVGLALAQSPSTIG
jgi:hypothetical protein